MLKLLINFLVFAPPPGGKTKKVICDEDKCTFCGKCKQECPRNAIMVDEFTRVYYSYRCNNCGRCIKACLAAALVANEKD